MLVNNETGVERDSQEKETTNASPKDQQNARKLREKR